MLKAGLVLGAIAMLVFASCGDKDPVSSSDTGEEGTSAAKLTVSADKAGGWKGERRAAGAAEGIAPGEPTSSGRWSFDLWLKGEFAEDLNEDGVIDRDDFSIFVNERPADGGPVIDDGMILPPDDPRAYPPDIDPGDSYVLLEKPTLLVAGNESEARWLAGHLNDPEQMAQFGEVDFDDTWIISVFRGQVNTAGYGIAIEDVQYITPAEGEESGEVVQITVHLTDPSPDQMVAEVISYPDHVVMVPKADLPAAEGTVWSAYTSEGELFAQTRYPSVIDGRVPGVEPIGTAVDGFGSSDEPGREVPIGSVVDGSGSSEDTGGDVIKGGGGGEVDQPPIAIDAEPISGEDSAQDSEEPTAAVKIDIRGNITDISEVSAENRERGILGTIRIEGALEEDTNVDQAVVEITEKTRILERDGDEVYSVRFESFEMGQRVQALFTGPVRESYPVQAVAMEIVILK